MSDFSIGITTFKRREQYLYSLVNNIRNQTNRDILITINQDYKEPADFGYINRIYKFVSEFDNIFVFVFPTFTSLSKMWNTIIINSQTKTNLILNDDVVIYDRFFNSINNIDVDSCVKINNTFGMFFINKTCAINLNFFDERLLAYGEEDGDFVWKYETTYKKTIPTIYNNLIENVQEGYRVENKLSKIDLGHRLVPRFNRELIQKMYKPTNSGVSGMFGSPSYKTTEFPDYKQYPYEMFKDENFGNL